MKIHEYQAKAILSKYGVAVPRGEMALTREEAEDAAKRLFDQKASGVVVKAQIHAGGRGKGGGVKVAKTLDEARHWIDKILGMRLVTHQTGPEGKIVQRLLIEETLPIERELYLSIVVDRATARPVFIQRGISASRQRIRNVSTASLPSSVASRIGLAPRGSCAHWRSRMGLVFSTRRARQWKAKSRATYAARRGSGTTRSSCIRRMGGRWRR